MTATLGVNKRVSEKFGITIKLKITSQAASIIKQILFLPHGKASELFVYPTCEGCFMVYLRTIYFQVDDKFFQQKDDMIMGAYDPSLAISIWSIMRKWLLTVHKTNHHCGTITLMTHLWSGFIAQRSYRISSATLIVQGFHPVHYGNRVRQCNSISGYSFIRKETTLTTETE
jgi:hypothetical protein